MKIEHVAIWVNDLERMRDFYKQYFDGEENSLYHNPKKKFESYFITFEGGARLELMKQVGIDDAIQTQTIGYAHIAFSVGSKEKVNELTNILREAGYPVLNGPRTTGDGYYESVVSDPEGNQIEITI
ncbi:MULTISPECIES: VOC family protein [Bacillus]|uniref:Glyoxalase/bleomycin resistance/extradiol dioxygenase family protein n=1 Tax=Bacillus cereus TaxID=1396 RepID=A0A2C1LF00_BACCE|nr:MULTISPECIES: VOC family protein [Bacillus]MDH4422083.1 VOC family protein [Bacillus cereus]PFA65596.1 glyoxalase/bleomycin resistance/extradiol dioxygenase family protein [Bacillus sp. AFS015896]PGL79969.1 glyoxalase/bleomycin resistance/extradiol dioxygenase family protein [Bacillus sp. AFS054943]PGT96813.1 glyoxalase/bleomycin resistance/extradiol dioxygenase family protein [Bacillus cereus]PGZ74844.1 glyoxalase/bleomycin resistance/extradiol dioxygenase family protein [Bacillus sp. AFS0